MFIALFNTITETYNRVELFLEFVLKLETLLRNDPSLMENIELAIKL
jgi:hypothetical protein